jgi:hypothetical protein
MTLLALFVVLVTLFYLLKVVVSAEFAFVVLAVIGLLVTLTYEECRYLLGLGAPPKGSSGLRHVRTIATRIAAALEYLDLSFLLFATMLLGVAVFNEFVAEIEDMVARGLMTFPKEKAGFVQLQIYLSGLVVLPSFLLALGGYGWTKGIKGINPSFLKLLAAVVLGLLMASCFFLVLRGEATSVSNYKIFPATYHGAFPFMLAGGSLFLLLFFAGFAWVIAQLARGIRFGMDRLAAKRKSAESLSTLSAQ